MPASKSPSDTLGLALRRLALAYAAQIDVQLARAGRGYHEGVHRARKAMTRLRALLVLAHTASKSTTPIERRVRTVAHSLSRLRDAQAACNMACNLSEASRDNDGRATWRAAIDALETHRDELLVAALRADPEFAERRKRISILRTALEEYDWSAVSRNDAETALEKSLRRARRAHKRAHTTAQAPRHRLRRRTRRLLLQIELLRKIAHDAKLRHAAKQARKLIAHESIHRRRRKRLVDALGDERDLRMLLRILRHVPSAPAIDGALNLVQRHLPHAIAASDALIG